MDEIVKNKILENCRNGRNYESWVLVTDNYFTNQYNVDSIVHDGWGYCILAGNNRVDIWNPDFPDSDLYKDQRERFNKNHHE